MFTFSLVVLFFFSCLMPLRIFLLWIITTPLENILALGMEGYYILLYFCRILFYINSAINPLLYNMTSARFRNAFFSACSGRRQRKHRKDFFTSFGRKTSDGAMLNRAGRGEKTSVTGSRSSNGRLASHNMSLCLTPTPVRRKANP